MAIDNQFGKGIGLAAGFDLGAQKPLDSRLAVNTIAERDAHVTENRAFEGMIVFVDETKKNYQLKNGAWVELFKDEQDRLNALEAMLNGEEGAEGGALGALQDAIDAVDARLNQGGDIENRIAGAESDIDGLQGLVGKPAEGEQSASGLHAALEDVEARLTETINNNKDGAAQAVAGEKERAMAAEDLLDKAIKAEADRADKEEKRIVGLVEAEATKAREEEGKLNQAIANEKQRAEGAEAGLQQAINTEKGRAEQAEQGLQNAIDAINNAENGILAQAKALDKADRDAQVLVDQAQDDRIKALEDANKEGGAVKEAIDQVQANLDEFEEAQGQKNNALDAEDQRLDQAIKDEAQAARAAEEQLGKDIDAEEQRAIAKENEIAQNLANEIARADAAEKANKKLIEDEAAEARKQEGLLQDAIDAEALARGNADTALDNRLKAVEASIGDGGNLEARVQANEDAIDVINGTGEGSIKKAVADLVNGAPDALNTLDELAAALRDNKDVLTAIENAFDGKLATLQADVDQNEADCDAAIKAEKERAMAEEADIRADFAAADAAEVQRVNQKIADDIAAESALRQAAEQGLQQAINKEVQDRADAVQGLANRHDQEMTAAEGRLDNLEAKFAGDNSVDNKIANAKQEALDAVEDEKDRAEAEEAEIRQEMATEAARVNQKIADDIAAESALRQAEEQRIEKALEDAIAKEVEDRDAAILVETNRAKAAEKAITDRLDAHLTTVAFDGDQNHTDLAPLA